MKNQHCPPCSGNCREGRACDADDDLQAPFDRTTTRLILLGLAGLWIALGGVLIFHLLVVR